MVRIKICGLTRLEDALFAEASGAHALGFIFHKNSKRYLEPRTAASIIIKLTPFISKVGVFVNEDPAAINRISEDTGLTHVQLHGDETLEEAESINRPVIKAMRFSANILQKIQSWKNYPLLIDSGSTDKPGGTGITLPWEKLKSIIQDKKIILAGGLNPENIADAIRIVKPYAVDVSSGVEKSPGIKNKELIEKFINNTKKKIK